MNFDFPRTLGQEDARQRLGRTLSQGRFPHALLVHGEPGLGQHALLLDLAQILSCEHPEARPCGSCFPCRAFDAASLETLNYLIPITKKEKDGDEGLEAGQIEELSERIQAWHATPYGLEAPEKTLVRVPQVRELIGRLSYAENKGRARIVLVPWLESLNTESANALLKTLEEPPANVYFLIASENRAALLPTLLSRCMNLGVSPLTPAEFRSAAETLSLRAGKPVSSLLPPFAEGSPGVYLELLQNGGEELLEEALRFLSAASAADWRVFSDYAGQGPAAQGLEETLKLLHFLLRMLRVHQSLRARHGAGGAEAPPLRGAADGYRWTAQALEKEGWDTALAPYLGPFEDVADLGAFAAFLEAAHRAVQGYSKPQLALIGLFLEYETKMRRAA